MSVPRLAALMVVLAVTTVSGAVERMSVMGQASPPPSSVAGSSAAQRGIRIGSARDGSVRGFIPDPCPYPYASGSTLAEGVTIDVEGNLYGADFLGAVRKFVKK